MKVFRLFIFILFTFHFNCHANENFEPAKASLVNSASGPYLNLTIEQGWKIYGPFPGHDGKPISISFDGSHNLISLTPQWPQPEFEGEENNINNYYSGALTIPLLVTSSNSDELELNLNVSMVACKDVCIHINKTLKLEKSASANNFHSNLLMTILLAIAGGFILNFMPCVLPVIALKLYSITKSGNDPQTRINSLFVALGILATFTCFSVLVIISHIAGTHLGWGMHFQQPVFIIAVTIAILPTKPQLHLPALS